MTAKKKISKKIAELSYETKALSLTIKNEDGVHTHSRNGEKFRGKQADCPLCKTGSEFERKMGAIGA
jgi:hypothetical protein